jgi:hypothetical protein
MMNVTSDWVLAKEVGAQRWARFSTTFADEAPRNLALVFQWIKVSFATPVKSGNFPPGVLDATKGVADSIKAAALGADPMPGLARLGPQNGLVLTKLVAGKSSAELIGGLKTLDGAAGVLYLYSTKDKRYTALAFGGPKNKKKLFDPFDGQLASDDVAELAGAVFFTYGKAFDTFVLVKAVEEVKSGPSWDWDFDQGHMIDKLTTGRYRATRSGGTLQKLFPDGCEGICLAMSFDWIKRTMAGTAATSAAYLDPKKFVKMAKFQLELEDSFLKLAPIAAQEGYTIDSSINSKDNPNLVGPFAGSTKDLVFKIDQLASGFYLLWTWGKDGHFMAFQKTGKVTGKFFDPNIGQATVAAGGESLGALVGAVFEDNEMYKAYFVDWKCDPPRKFGQGYLFSQVTKK